MLKTIINVELVLYALFLTTTHFGVNTLLVFIGLTLIYIVKKQPTILHELIREPIIKALIVFFSALLITIPFSYNPTESITQWGRYVSYLLPFLLCMALRHTPETEEININQILYALMLGVIISGSYGIYQFLVTGDLFIKPFTHHHAVYGSMLEIIIPLALSILALSNSKWLKTTSVITFFIGSIALILTQARGPWIATFIGIITVIYLLSMGGSINKRHIGIFAIVLCLLLVSTFPLYADRVKSTSNLSWGSNSERLLIWSSSLQIIADHPITGIGIAQFNEIYNDRYISPLSIEKFHPHAHNSYLGMFVEGGIIGFAAMMLLLYQIHKSLWLTLREHIQSPLVIGAIAGLIAILVNSFVDSFIWGPRAAKALWFVIGLSFYRNAIPNKCCKSQRLSC